MDPLDRCSAEPVLEPKHEDDHLIWDLEVPPYITPSDATVQPIGSMVLRWYEDGRITMSAVGPAMDYMRRKDEARKRGRR